MGPKSCNFLGSLLNMRVMELDLLCGETNSDYPSDYLSKIYKFSSVHNYVR